MKYFSVFALLCCLLGVAMAQVKNRKYLKLKFFNYFYKETVKFQRKNVV